MDPEQTFLRVHARLSGMLSQLLTPRIRLVLEYVYLAVAVTIFCLLVVMHINFVQQPGCSMELSGINFTEAQLVRIKITSGDLWAHISGEQKMEKSQREGNLIDSTTPYVNGDGFTILSTKFWSHWIGSGARSSKLILKSWKGEREFLEPQVEKAADTTISKSIKAVLIGIFNKWKLYVSSYRRIMKQFSISGSQVWNTAGWDVLDTPKFLKMLRFEHLKSFIVQWLERRSKAFEPTYLYTSEKGYFLLPEAAKARHNVQTINVTVSAKNPCFGNSSCLV